MKYKILGGKWNNISGHLMEAMADNIQHKQLFSQIPLCYIWQTSTSNL